MKRLLLGLVVLIGFSGSFATAESYSGYAPFPSIGRKAVEEVWKKLNRCGLIRTSAFDPRLPTPQIPAQQAIVSPGGELLAYYMETYGAGFGAQFKNPNGGYSHSVWFTNGNIQFVTPYAGTVAHGNTWATVGGVGTNTYCQSNPVHSRAFLKCIEALWVNQIAGQLCRFNR